MKIFPHGLVGTFRRFFWGILLDKTQLGLMRLGTRYGNERLEAACERALSFDLVSYRGVRDILAAGMDRLKAETTSARPEKPHANLRGPRYYS